MAVKRGVTIKGTRDGLSLYMDDTYSYKDLLAELEEVLSAQHILEDEPLIKVTIELGNRYLTKEQQDEVRQIFDKHNKLVIDKIKSNLIEKKTALEWKEQTDIKMYHRMVRSGQVLQVEGDLFLIGDVNPGGKVMASGNVFILGSLKGIAHAGCYGNKKAVIAASYMAPSQLRIADVISRPPDSEDEGIYMECGFLDESFEKIRMERVTALSKVRPELNGFERRVMNG